MYNAEIEKAISDFIKYLGEHPEVADNMENFLEFLGISC